MSDIDLEALLPIARPAAQSTTTPFTRAVMQQVRHTATFQPHGRTKNATKLGAFMRMVKLHKAAALIIAAVALSLISFTSYSYATGSDPVSVLKRWVTGDNVQVEYNGHTYTYGKKLSYSDAAITAFAELDTVRQLHGTGINFFIVPKNGIEYVSDPTAVDEPYTYPWVGTVQQVTGDTVVIQKQFITGDKMSRIQNTDETVTLPISDVSYIVQGNPAAASADAVGKVVEVYQDAYIRHHISTADPLEHVTHYFTYQLTHTVDEVKEASQQPTSYADPTTRPIQASDFGFGGDLNVCYNNGADTCPNLLRSGDGSQGLFGNSVDPYTHKDYGPKSNPAVVDFIRRPPEIPDTSGGLWKRVIIRDTEGAITAITPAGFTIKTSSGAHWTFAYDRTLQQAFAKEFGALKTGDHISASIVSPLDNLDNRSIDSSHIDQLARLKP